MGKDKKLERTNRMKEDSEEGLNESVTNGKTGPTEDPYLIGRGDPNLSPDAGRRLK